MCKQEYINIQTGEKLDWNKVEGLKDNAMLKVNPYLWMELDLSKNEEERVNIWNITKSSSKYVWWYCEKCNDSYNMRVDNKYHGKQKCPYCAGKRVNEGNSLAFKLPEIIDWWDFKNNIETPHTITFGKTIEVNLRCPECYLLIKNKLLNNILKRGLRCPRCSDGLSIGEKITYNILSELKIDFIHDSSFNWSHNKRYDFYIPLSNTVIEVHGEQHRDKQIRKNSRTVSEEKENDAFKKSLAIKELRATYIEVNYTTGKHQEFYDEVIFICSKYYNVDKINKADILSKSFSTLIREASNLWANGVTSSTKIAEILKLSRVTILKYLHIANDLGWIEYNYNIARKSFGSVKNNKILMIKEGKVINEFSGADKAIEHLGRGHKTMIYNCCIGKSKTAYGYEWTYIEGYKSKNRSLQFNMNSRKIVQLDFNMMHINEYNSISEANTSLGVKRSHISSVCSGNRKRSNGFKWMYKEDYDKYIEEQNKAI